MDKNLNTDSSKKLGWSLFVFEMKSALQNAWQMYILCLSSSSKPQDLLSFRRKINLMYFQWSKDNLPGQGRLIAKIRRSKLLDSIRYDGSSQ